jgi:predicted metal-dependent phosphoesterase TrpH
VRVGHGGAGRMSVACSVHLVTPLDLSVPAPATDALASRVGALGFPIPDRAGDARMIKVDLHVHTSYSVDGRISPETLVDLSPRRGLGALAITDHNTIARALAVRKIAPFPVIVGEEISTADGEVLGLFLEEGVPRNLSASETLRLIKQQGGLAGVPHPYDRLRRESIERGVLGDLAGELDFVEGFNARVTCGRDNHLAREFARSMVIPCTAGSDAHSAYELGRAYVEMGRFEGKEQFTEMLYKGHIGGGLSPFWVHFFSIYERARRTLRRE